MEMHIQGAQLLIQSALYCYKILLVGEIYFALSNLYLGTVNQKFGAELLNKDLD
jgi:hypothetical protein